MNFWGGAAAAAAICATATAAAAAEPIAVNLPAGSVGQQVVALGRLGRASIVVPDPQLWSRRVPALRGRLTIEAALTRIARDAGARMQPIGPVSWRLVPQRRVKVALARPPARPRPAPVSEAPVAEVIVTASKRDTSRRHFAGQYARVSGTDLEFGGTGGTERLANRLTSVASTYLGAGRNKLFIRGIADSSFTGPTQATVGQYFGDLRLSYNAPDPDLRLSDLAAVEVLEGPQGTLYGAGSLGGLIRLVPTRPIRRGPAYPQRWADRRPHTADPARTRSWWRTCRWSPTVSLSGLSPTLRPRGVTSTSRCSIAPTSTAPASRAGAPRLISISRQDGASN